MVMNFLPPDIFESGEIYESFSSCHRTVYEEPAPARHDFHILREKLTVPIFDALVPRPRLDETLQKSLAHYSATMLCGRAGSGKSALAAGFSKRYKHVAWYSADAADADWKAFANYFAAAAADALGGKPAEVPGCDATAMAEFLEKVFAKAGRRGKKPMLFVLDDIHRIFDADWFCEFFHLLLFSLPENVHLLLLCRSKPPNPLWRLRSKQVLNVIDEKLLAFTEAETATFFETLGLPETAAARAHSESYGRISKLMQIAVRCDGTGGTGHA